MIEELKVWLKLNIDLAIKIYEDRCRHKSFIVEQSYYDGFSEALIKCYEQIIELEEKRK